MFISDNSECFTVRARSTTPAVRRGKMLLMMMAVLEDISLWAYVHIAHATRHTLLHAFTHESGPYNQWS